MKLPYLRTALLGTALIAGTIALTPAAMAGNKDRMYRVTIQDATLGQPLSPPVIATHTGAFHLFDLGPVPTIGDDDYDLYFALATVAETGYPFHLLAEVSASYGVWEAQVVGGSPLPHGQSISTTISASGNSKYLTAASMLGRTNDAFWALRGVELPRGIGDTARYFANGYDAGSEANDESVATVGALGMPTDGDDGMSGAGINTNGEGYIVVHPGVHGVGGAGGLDPAVDDWRDPVVELTIERIK